MSVNETIELLGKGLYKGIPDTITLTSIPTASELDYVGAEDFDKVMFEKILPQVIEEDINLEELLEMDYLWILRCLRILNYGPYATTNRIWCNECDTVNEGEYQVNITSIPVQAPPEGFTNSIIISKDEFLDFNKDIEVSMLTIRDTLNILKDNQFKTAKGDINTTLGRLSYMIKRIGQNTVNPVEARLAINKLSPADYIILQDVVDSLTQYGLKLLGTCDCPNCKRHTGRFAVPINDKFFRPTLADLRRWKSDRVQRSEEVVSGVASGSIL